MHCKNVTKIEFVWPFKDLILLIAKIIIKIIMIIIIIVIIEINKKYD